MEHLSSEVLISQIIILLGLSVIVIYFGLKLKMPAIVGFLATGILVGPQGLGLIRDSHQVDALAELGVVLLLFTIGLEFSLQNLLKIKRIVLLGGSLQMLFSIAVTTPLARLAGYDWNTALTFGFLFALSSTAIVLKLLQEKGEMDSLHGRGILGVLIFQDLAVVPLVLALPFLAGEPEGDPWYLAAGKAAAILSLVLVMANQLVPRLFRRIAATRSQELFLFTVALVCLGTAFLTAEAGLSLALGAFVSGLVISGSPYAYQAISSVMPMRNIFTSLFFVSIGMLMDIRHLAAHPGLTIALTLGVMLLNTLTCIAAMRVTGLNSRVAVTIGFALCQVGEFSFVLAKTGGELGLIIGDDMTLFLNAAVLTMALTPLAVFLGRMAALKCAGLDQIDLGPRSQTTGHAVVVGFGPAGQGVARACKVAGRPYSVIDLNPQSVQIHQKQGEPIIFGDAVNEAILEHVGVKQAAILVVTIPDPLATRRIIVQARSLNPNLHILARTRFLLTRDILLKLGADDVLAEESVAAVNVFDRVMKFYEIDPAERKARLEEAVQRGPGQFHLLDR